MNQPELVWQLHDLNEWVFGKMVRGVVRRPYFAEIYYDEDKNPSWAWFTTMPGLHKLPRGFENCLDDAITAAEQALRELGILPPEVEDAVPG